MQNELWVVQGPYREHLREIAQGDFGDADGGFWHVVRYDGRTQQLAIADRRKVDVEYNTVVDGEAHELQNRRRQGSIDTDKTVQLICAALFTLR